MQTSIKMSDIEKYRHDGKQLVEFGYRLVSDAPDNPLLTVVRFSQFGNSQTYKVETTFRATEYQTLEAYSFLIQMPRERLPIPLVVETGLRMLISLIVESVSLMSEINMKISSIIGTGI